MKFSGTVSLATFCLPLAPPSFPHLQKGSSVQVPGLNHGFPPKQEGRASQPADPLSPLPAFCNARQKHAAGRIPLAHASLVPYLLRSGWREWWLGQDYVTKVLTLLPACWLSLRLESTFTRVFGHQVQLSACQLLSGACAAGS